MAIKFFGFELKKSSQEKEQEKLTQSPAPPTSLDGAITINVAMKGGDAFGYNTHTPINEFLLITKYREMEVHPQADSAIDDICNESLTIGEKSPTVELDFRVDSKISDSIRKKITEEFKGCLKLLDFQNQGYTVFRRWYVDGRIYYHALVTPGKESEGIKELRYIDPRQIKKIRELTTQKDPKTGLDAIRTQAEYFLFSETGIKQEMQLNTIPYHNPMIPNMYTSYKLTKDSVVYSHSGIVDKYANTVFSNLHKAIRPLNQLKMMQDASVIYRITRAPERRIFYVDVGSLPTSKAQQYMKSVMTKFRNKLIYNHETGEIQGDKQFYSMQEDLWIPRKDNSTGTSVDTLPGGQNLSQIEDIEYFQRQFYQSLNVPIGRLDSQNNFNVGRVTEITRDEVKFQKFILRLRQQFSTLFLDILKKQLILKKIITPDYWDEIKDDLYFIFSRDNYFSELKEQEILLARANILKEIEPFIGKFYSYQWVRENILQQSEELINLIDKQIKEEHNEYVEKQKGIFEIQNAGMQEQLDQMSQEAPYEKKLPPKIKVLDKKDKETQQREIQKGNDKLSSLK